MTENIFNLPLVLDQAEEHTDILWSGSDFRMERIVSTGQCSPNGFWYDQNEDEMVILLQGDAVLSYENGTQTLHRGDQLFIPAHMRHRVEKTSIQPPCIWLCIFRKHIEKK